MRARRAMAGETAPLALVALVRRNRSRYGGYIVHLGIAVLFVGVAASSSFQHATELGLTPGQSARVGAYTIRYVRPTATITPQVRRGPHRLDAHPGGGAGRHQGRPSRGHAVPERGLLRLRGTQPGVGGQPDRRPAGQPRRRWTRASRATCGRRSQPDIEAPGAAADRDDRQPARCRRRRGRSWRSRYLARAYLKHPPQAQFHLIVSPLVMWIWIGGMIVVRRRPDRDLAGAERGGAVSCVARAVRSRRTRLRGLARV